MLPGPGVDDRMRRLIADTRRRDGLVRCGGAAGAAGAACPQAGARRVRRQHARPRGRLVDAAGGAHRHCAASATTPTSSPTSARYTRGRFASAFGPHAALEYLPPGVDTDRFAPDPAARARDAVALRPRRPPGGRRVSRLVPRKGQDMLIRALPAIRERVDGAALVIVGGGPYRTTLRELAARCRGRPTTSSSPAACRAPNCPRITRWPTCSRCRAGRAAPGWTSRASASSSWRRRRPACRSSRATPAARRRRCRTASPDASSTAATSTRSPTAVSGLLADPTAAAEMGAAGRRWAVDNWQWRNQAARLHSQLTG